MRKGNFKNIYRKRTWKTVLNIKTIGVIYKYFILNMHKC